MTIPPQFGEMLDTSPEARRKYYAGLAALTSTQRLAIACAQTRAVRALAEAAIRRDHPDISLQELRARLAVRLYGRSLAETVLGDVPPDAR